MATQMGVVSNNPYLRRRYQTDELNARLQRLPQIIANQQRAEDLTRQDELNKIQQAQWGKQYKLGRKQLGVDKMRMKNEAQAARNAQRAERATMGLEAGKLGLTVADQFGKKTTGNLYGGSGSSAGGTASGLGNINLGSGLAGGLAGFGAASMLGSNKKSKKAKLKNTAIGAGAGALMGYLGGGLGGALSGAVGGGGGGFAASLF